MGISIGDRVGDWGAHCMSSFRIPYEGYGGLAPGPGCGSALVFSHWPLTDLADC